MLVLAALAVAQERRTTTYTYDLHGRPSASAQAAESVSAAGKSRVETMRTINGRNAPAESVEERVISEGPEGRIVERIVRPYDADGRPGPPEKTRIEERKNADGSATVETTLHRGDLNGGFRLWERSTTETRKSGGVENSETVVQRPGLNASLEISEKQVSTRREDPNSADGNLAIYRRGADGRFYEAVREISQRRQQNGQTTETTTSYNATNTGKLEFAGQTVSTTVKNPDGSETSAIDVYGVAIPGRPVDSYSPGPKLREQQLIERRKTSSDSTVETFSIRRPSLTDPAQLGAYQRISEKVCTGACGPAPKK